MPDERAFDIDGTAVAGRATTVGQALPLGVDDPVIAARAVRRALADARWRATDVDALHVATPPPLTLDAVERFARRALGSHGATVPCAAIATEEDGGARLAVLAAGTDRGPAVRRVAVGIGRDGEAVALCVVTTGRGRP